MTNPSTGVAQFRADDCARSGGDGAIVPYERWLARSDDLHREFVSAEPFPAVVLDDFLAADAAQSVLSSFPNLDSAGWINYIRINERTFGMRNRDTMSKAAAEVLDELNSDAFLDLLGKVTGISGLKADQSLEGAGLHLSDRNGFLNVHADFNIHPHRPHWRRRLNLLIYLNPDWNESWGGELEFWDAAVQRCVRKISPVFNRAVLFQTDDRSFHGYPDPLQCPGDVTRKSLALYYFTHEDKPPRPRSTNHQPRPDDGAYRRALILLDKAALRVYDRSKRLLGFDDAVVSRILGAISHRQKRPEN